jgi:L-histidine N-alpha-methyltransferase
MRETGIAAGRAADAFVEDIRYYLSLHPRQLPSRYLYDDLGSALFEAICQLPWYRVTRAEQRLLAAHAGEIFAKAGHLSQLLELGPGNGEKLARLIETGYRGSGPLNVHLIDVSGAALAVAERTLGALDGLSVHAHEMSYEAGLLDFAEAPRRFAGSSRAATLALFLGSNIGNFDRPAAEAFLGGIRAALRPGDALLIGADLVKPEAELLLAYDDPLGVTAAFNLNVLCHLNRRLNGDFNLRNFEHRAIWNGPESRVEMHLVSRVQQRVRLAGADIELKLEAGETIWTESSYKFDRRDLVRHLESAGFDTLNQWVDEGDQFALTLARAV